jgi:hypothetical protein
MADERDDCECATCRLKRLAHARAERIIEYEARLAAAEAAQRDAEERVRAAYFEGWNDGHDKGISCGHPLHSCRCNKALIADDYWPYSQAALAPATPAGEGKEG